uniref:Polyprotein n=1 Tax=Heligmosomoides polygyrus TaxID=6339 RepID=A0A183GMW3_HELPZ
LNGDGNARKVIITIDRSFQNVVGNDTAVVASKWCESISSMLRVSIYRFKNARVSLGIVFNVTITLPFEDDADKLSAEEISLMLMECSEYQEFDLHSIQGETLPVQPITDNDVVELIVNRQLNPLALSLIIVISTILAFVSLYVGGAVVVKVRTDRLVQEMRLAAVLSIAFITVSQCIQIRVNKQLPPGSTSSKPIVIRAGKITVNAPKATPLPAGLNTLDFIGMEARTVKDSYRFLGFSRAIIGVVKDT